MASLTDLTETVRQRAASNPGFGHTIKFDLGGEGVIFFDGKSNPAIVSNDNQDAECTLTLSADNFEKMLNGDLDPTLAYMTGKLKVAGAMGVAMKLSSVLGG